MHIQLIRIKKSVLWACDFAGCAKGRGWIWLRFDFQNRKRHLTYAQTDDFIFTRQLTITKYNQKAQNRRNWLIDLIYFLFVTRSSWVQVPELERVDESELAPKDRLVSPLCLTTFGESVLTLHLMCNKESQDMWKKNPSYPREAINVACFIRMPLKTQSEGHVQLQSQTEPSMFLRAPEKAPVPVSWLLRNLGRLLSLYRKKKRTVHTNHNMESSKTHPVSVYVGWICGTWFQEKRARETGLEITYRMSNRWSCVTPATNPILYLYNLHKLS